MHRHLPKILVVLLLFAFCGCDRMPSKATMIKQVIQGANSAKAQVMADSDGVMHDMKIYQDGTNDGVVYEMIFAKGVPVDRSMMTEASVKSEMVKQFAGDKDIKKVMESGIYIRFMYKSFEGETYVDTKLTDKDL